MSIKKQLKETFGALFSQVRLDLHTAESLSNLAYGDLAQAIALRAKPIYRFYVDYDGSFGGYRSELLTPHKGTLLYTDIETSDLSLLRVLRSRELWILDDLTLVVLSAVELSNSEDQVSATYRTIKTWDMAEIPDEIDIDYDELAIALTDMSVEHYAEPMIYQEL